MLSDNDILEVMNEGLLSISPFDKKQLRPAGISFHLGVEILVPKPVKLIDLKAETELKYETAQVSEDIPFIIRPGQFVLGHTEEVISVSTKLGFIIEGRSTLARLGVSVEQSATIVDPGHHQRPITLEIYNCGPSPVTLYRGMSVAKALVFRLSSEAGRSFDKYARYASQKSGVGKPILKLKSE
jgi:dCTP deaminase